MSDILRNIAWFTFIPEKIFCFKGLWIKDNQYLNILLYFNKMLTILVRLKILTDALASVASVWIRACYSILQYITATSRQYGYQPGMSLYTIVYYNKSRVPAGDTAISRACL
jgi:hypothetical protein